ncbi:MAG: hypothetical protein ACRDH5_10035 [bacterium]
MAGRREQDHDEQHVKLHQRWRARAVRAEAERRRLRERLARARSELQRLRAADHNLRRRRGPRGDA